MNRRKVIDKLIKMLRFENSSNKTWRGYDLQARIAKIERAFQCQPVTCADDIPILVNTPTYFSFGSLDKPHDYYSNSASMLEYQASGYEKHLNLVHDDLVPYFMPWFGTGVLASGFGANIRIPDDPADDPAVLEACIKTPSDAARMRLPDPTQDGWMPRVLDSIDFAVSMQDLPVGLTDMQGPLDTVGQMCGQAQLYKWMYSEPKMIHELMDLVTTAFIDWVMVQKQHIGEPLDQSNGLQGAYSPGCGVWESDDDLVLVDPGLYQEFVVPYVSRIFKAFGGGSVHFCGNGAPHLDNLLQIENLRVINNSPLGNYSAFEKLYKGLGNRVTFQVQDASSSEPENYYARLFSQIEDFRGLMLVTFVMDNVGMDNQGGYIPVSWNPYKTANRIVDSVRRVIEMRLAGQPVIVDDIEQEQTAPSTKKGSGADLEKSDFPYDQMATLEVVRRALIDFDNQAIKEGVESALEAGLQPFDIISYGMAEGMNEVGQLYETGVYFLPQLVMAGATLQEGMTILAPLLKDEGDEGNINRGKVVLGTVKGDLHDIGKNLVRMMLEGARFEVIDLGVDVDPEEFISAVKRHNAGLVGLSALLTTTLPSMKVIIEAFDKAGLRDQVKIIIGGAPLSQEYADQIGADGYAQSAVGAVYEVERLLGLD